MSKGTMHEYPFPINEYRASLKKIISNEEVELLIDLGFHSYKAVRVTMHGVKNVEPRARKFLEEHLTTEDSALEWPLRVFICKNPDDNSKFIARIYVWVYIGNSKREICISEYMVQSKLAELRMY